MSGSNDTSPPSVSWWKTLLRAVPALTGAVLIAMLQAKPSDMISNASAWMRFAGIGSLPLWFVAPRMDALLLIFLLLVVVGSLFWAFWPILRRSRAAILENSSIIVAVTLTALVVGLITSRLIPYPPDIYTPPQRNADAPVSVSVLPTRLRILFKEGQRPEELESSNTIWTWVWVPEKVKNPRYTSPATQTQQPSQSPLLSPFSGLSTQFPQTTPSEPEYVYKYNLVLFVSFRHSILYGDVSVDYHGADLPKPEIISRKDQFVVIRIHEYVGDALIDIRLNE